MKAKNTLYWTAVIIGILLVWFVVYTSTNKTQEHFQATTTSSTDTTPPEFNEITDEYAKFPLSFPGYSATPNLNRLFVYLSSYSRKTQTKEDVYDKTIMKWRNMIDNPDTTFTLQTTNTITLPDSLISSTNVQGLNIKGVSLVGPPSDYFKQDSSYELPSFSVAFFMQWLEQDIAAEDEHILFEMFAESPSYVCWKIVRKDETTARVDVILGNYNTTYAWEVPISTVVSNGYYTLYCLTYNKQDKKIVMYIGPKGVYQKTLSETPSVLLANTPVSINKNKTLPVSLRAFAFIKDLVLTQPLIADLNEYFMKMSNGAQSLLSQAQQQIKEATENTTVVKKQLDETQQTVNSLMNQLSKCKASTDTPSKSNVSLPLPQKKWNISADMLNGVRPSQTTCTALDVKKFGDEATNSPFTQQVPPDMASKYAPKKPFVDYDIANPTKPNATPNTSNITPEPTPTPASTTTSSSTTPKSDMSPNTSAFWKGMFNALSTMQTSNVEKQSNESQSNNEDTAPFWRGMYDTLLSSNVSQGNDAIVDQLRASGAPSSSNISISQPAEGVKATSQVSLWSYLTKYMT
jgi:hypothetical protein